MKSVQSVVSSSEYKFKAHTEREDDRPVGDNPLHRVLRRCEGIGCLGEAYRRVGGLKLDKEHEDKLELDLGTKQ